MSEPIQPDKQLTPQAERVLQMITDFLLFECRTPLLQPLHY